MSAASSDERFWQSSTFCIGCSFLVTGLVIFMLLHAHRAPLYRPDLTATLPGFTADEMPSPAKGLVVTSLRTGGEAQRVGIEVGDEVVAIDQNPIQSLSDADRLVNHDARDRLTVHLLHNGIPRDVVFRRIKDKRHGA